MSEGVSQRQICSFKAEEANGCDYGIALSAESTERQEWLETVRRSMFKFLNIERDYSDTDLPWLEKLEEKANPAMLSVSLKHDKDLLRYFVRLELVEDYDQHSDDEEGQIHNQMIRTRYLMDLFDKFYAQAGDEEVSIIIEFSDDMQSAQVKLKTAQRTTHRWLYTQRYMKF